MPNQQRDDAQYDYVEDLSFARIFLGMGPKTVRTRKPVGARAGMVSLGEKVFFGGGGFGYVEGTCEGVCVG